MSRVITTAPVGSPVRVRDRRDGERDGELAAVLVPVDGAGEVEALAELRRDRGARTPRRSRLAGEQRDRLADRLGSPRSRRCASAPVLQLTIVPSRSMPTIASAADVADGAQLARDEAARRGRAAPARREPAGERRRRRARPAAPIERAERLVGDEEEVERPAGAGDREPAPDPADRAREGGDQEPGGDGDARIAVVPVPEQGDEPLEHDAEDDGDECGGRASKGGRRPPSGRPSRARSGSSAWQGLSPSPAARVSAGEWRAMKRLHLLRHAKSSWDDTGLPDHDRPLAPRGAQGGGADRRAPARGGDRARARPLLDGAPHPPDAGRAPAGARRATWRSGWRTSLYGASRDGLSSRACARCDDGVSAPSS